MKAWTVREKYEFCAAVVFAETRGKAKSKALFTDCCRDADYCDIEAIRSPELDEYYTEGKDEMDWDDQNDRIVLVKKGWYCDEDVRCEEECNHCPARKWCMVIL